MTLQKTVIALALLSLFPLSANAQDANNVNSNLANVVAGQQMQDAAKRLNTTYSGSLFGLTRQQKKLARAKYRQELKMAAMQNNDNVSNRARSTETGNTEN